MKKRIVSAILLLSILTFPLSARSFGYFVALDGEKTVDNGYGGASIGFAYEPWEFTLFNPSLVLTTSMGTDTGGAFLVPATTLVLNVDLVRTLKHPFTFIAHNRVAYDPSIGVGVQLRYDGPVRAGLYLTACPLKFSQPDFWYEALSPFCSYSDGKWSWGVTLFRFTFLCL